jgi:hypothetical protein
MSRAHRVRLFQQQHGTSGPTISGAAGRAEIPNCCNQARALTTLNEPKRRCYNSKQSHGISSVTQIASPPPLDAFCTIQ